MSSNKPPEKIQPSRGELFLVATPIGNLKDITLRALETLESVDRIACEDTRTSGILLKHYGIKTPTFSYHTHNEAEMTEQLITQLQSGKRIALISDAGTPLLSDPGARLVTACIESNIRVTPIPGASALLSAITIAGLPADQFFYAGFLPTKTTARKTALQTLANIPSTLVFYEAPHRLLETLAAMNETLGPREAAVARELTKLYEECIRLPLPQLITHYEQTPPRGECVILVSGALPTAELTDTEIDTALTAALKTLRLKEAVAHVAAQTNRPKSEIYARALALKEAP